MGPATATSGARSPVVQRSTTTSTDVVSRGVHRAAWNRSTWMTSSTVSPNPTVYVSVWRIGKNSGAEVPVVFTG